MAPNVTSCSVLSPVPESGAIMLSAEVNRVPETMHWPSNKDVSKRMRPENSKGRITVWH